MSNDQSSEDFLKNKAEEFADLKEKLGDKMNRESFINNFKQQSNTSDIFAKKIKIEDQDNDFKN